MCFWQELTIANMLSTINRLSTGYQRTNRTTNSLWPLLCLLSMCHKRAPLIINETLILYQCYQKAMTGFPTHFQRAIDMLSLCWNMPCCMQTIYQENAAELLSICSDMLSMCYQRTLGGLSMRYQFAIDLLDRLAACYGYNDHIIVSAVNLLQIYMNLLSTCYREL